MRLPRPYYALALAAAIGSTAMGQATITISPTSAVVRLGGTLQFTDRVTNDPSGVSWTLSLPPGETGSPGSISVGGRYAPPPAFPTGGNTVIVTVTTLTTPPAAASATITLENPYPTLSSTIPASVAVGAFTITLNGSNFVSGSQALVGGVALPTTYVSPTRLTATGTATAAQNNTRVAVAVSNPAPGPATSIDDVTLVVGTVDSAPKISATVAARFLDQAAFGPDAETVKHVQGTGLAAYITEQISLPASPYPNPVDVGAGLGQVQARFFSNAVHGQDQLRQRVALALSEIMVASGVEENTPTQLVPYLQVFQKDAFGNFRTLMNDITLNVAMGEYLDMRNNDMANPVTGTRANENYARELMQLFTIGLLQLNSDGTLQLDSKGNPIPTYDQTTIQNFAKVFTGWTYPTKPGATPAKHNPAYYVGPMVAFEANHDATSKTLLNYAAPAGVLTTLPAGQTAELDLSEALDNIFYHPNVGPFISRQLIQHLVTSNPSPAYVGRIAAVFNSDANGKRGNLAAVVRAILTDTEARAGDNGVSLTPPDTSGHLREPMFMIPAILRGLGAEVNDSNGLNGLTTNLGQTVFNPPTVFSYFTPGYQLPLEYTSGVALNGPEFQLQSPSSAVARFNTVNSIIYGNLGAGAVIDLTPYINLGGNPTGLIAAINTAFFRGLMPSTMQNDILSAVNAITGTTPAANKARAQVALYLALSSSYYNVEH